MLSAIANRRLTNAVPRPGVERLRAFRRTAEDALPGRVVTAVLFGSRARGDAHRDSDYDVAVFVRALTDRRFVDHLLADAAYPHILAGFHLRPVAIPADFLESRYDSTFAATLARDGIEIP